MENTRAMGARGRGSGSGSYMSRGNQFWKAYHSYCVVCVNDPNLCRNNTIARVAPKATGRREAARPAAFASDQGIKNRFAASNRAHFWPSQQMQVQLQRWACHLSAPCDDFETRRHYTHC